MLLPISPFCLPSHPALSCAPHSPIAPPAAQPTYPVAPTHRLALERGDGLQLSSDIVISRLEPLEELLALGDDVLVLEDPTVVLKVDLVRARLELAVLEAGLGGALAEGGEGGEGL